MTGEAISYTLNQWAKLGVFLQDDRVQIDNNLVENTIRPSAIGKKNCLRLRSQASHGACRYRGKAVAVHGRRAIRLPCRHVLPLHC